MNKCKIYVVRHGESEHNLNDIVSGHVNPQLTDRGVQQALAAKDRLSNVHFDDVYSSDLDRAAETARHIYGQPVPIAHRLAELRERNFGALDGRPDEELRQVHNQHKNIHGELTGEERWHNKLAPDMESDHEVAERFIKAIISIAKKNTGKTILIAAHGGTVRTMLIGLKHGTQADFPPGSIKNASFVELSWDGSRLVVDSAEDAVNNHSTQV